MGAQSRRLQRQSRRRGLSQALQRDGPRSISRRDHAGGGIHLLVRRVAADQPGRSRLRLQMEHGLDERHAGLYGHGSHSSKMAPRQADLWTALCVFGEFRSAALARRGRAWQRLDYRQNARRRMAPVRGRPRLLRLHVGAARQEAAVHGAGIRPDERMEFRSRARMVAARPRPASRSARFRPRPQSPLSRARSALCARLRERGL